jgi:ElaB/YqjD/DUF883 family membrane-anchored ribosome-binding protein
VSNAKRKDIKERIEAGTARNTERARTLAERADAARSQAVEFARAHPLALIAGGLALGIAISALFPRSPTRKIGKQVGKKMGSRAASLAALASEFAILYGERALEAAQEARRTGQDRIEDFGDAAGDRARRLKREAAHVAGSASDGARAFTRDAGKKVSRAIRDRLN